MTERDHGVPVGVKIVELPIDPYRPNSPTTKRAVIVEPDDAKNDPYRVVVVEDAKS